MFNRFDFQIRESLLRFHTKQICFKDNDYDQESVFLQCTQGIAPENTFAYTLELPSFLNQNSFPEIDQALKIIEADLDQKFIKLGFGDVSSVTATALSVQRTTDGSVDFSLFLQPIAFDSITYESNPNSFVSNSTFNVPVAGVYKIEATVVVASTTTQSDLILTLVKNNSTVLSEIEFNLGISSITRGAYSIRQKSSISMITELNVNDLINVKLKSLTTSQSFSGIGSSMTIHRI